MLRAESSDPGRGNVMALIKGLIPGFLLTFIVSLILGSNQSRGGFLDIFRATIEGQSFYWSWPLFIAGTLMCTAIFKMME
jgi:hypothetical protein